MNIANYLIIRFLIVKVCVKLVMNIIEHGKRN